MSPEEETTEANPQDAPARSAQRGRPRDEAFDARILEAGFEELARGGISHFSISAVARRAGVAKGSIYLRWPTREQLIIDASATVLTEISPPGPGPIREQMRELADHWGAVFSSPRAVELLLRVDADRDKYPELFRTIFQSVQGAGNRIVEQTIRDAQQRGEVLGDLRPELLTRMFVGALFVEALAHTPAGQISDAFRDHLVEALVRAMRAPDTA
jgi:AcrR family transcriptional regulator